MENNYWHHYSLHVETGREGLKIISSLSHANWHSRACVPYNFFWASSAVTALGLVEKARKPELTRDANSSPEGDDIFDSSILTKKHATSQTISSIRPPESDWISSMLRRECLVWHIKTLLSLTSDKKWELIALYFSTFPKPARLSAGILEHTTKERFTFNSFHSFPQTSSS